MYLEFDIYLALNILCRYIPGTYTVLHIFAQMVFWSGNQDNHQNSVLSIIPYKWMGLNFDDYSGFQPKITPAQRYATRCIH